jgi:RimJ/RimL family protein N-acetyltransferase
MNPIPPERVETPRMILRRWDPADAALLDDALTATWPDLQRWIPWVFGARQDLAGLRERLAGYARDFVDGGDALYAMTTPDGALVLGGAGLYRRVGAGRLEIGYWVRSDRAGSGLATEAAAALTEVGLALEGIDFLEIRCEPDHLASIAVPRRLGYRHRETLSGGCVPAGDARDTMIWELARGQAPR